MFAEDRLREILDILNRDESVYVKDLSLRFNVSEPLIRKDLQRLDKEGKLQRTYGGAIIKRKKAISTSIGTRLIKNKDNKSIIAEKAFQEIEEGDMIFLDVSSCNYLLAGLLAKRNERITIITTMVELTSLFKNNTNTTLICIGGIYNKILGGVSGSEAIDNISKYRPDKAFMGTSGINLEGNAISNFDLEECNTKKAIINASKKVYIVMENEKFYFDGSYKFASLSDINILITGGAPEEKIKNILIKNNIILL